MTKDAFRRCILDALAEGYSYDAFRTALRTKLRALEAEVARCDSAVSEETVDDLDAILGHSRLLHRARQILGRRPTAAEHALILEYGEEALKAMRP